MHDGGPAYSAPARLIVAATSDAQGTLDVLRGGLVQASFIGIARANGAHTSGSALVRIDGGEITADTVEIGLTGHLVNNGVTTAQVTNWGVISGSGALVGDLVNHGTTNPGNPPGTLTVLGNFTGAAGSQIVLEVADDGQGGYVTGRLVINGASGAWTAPRRTSSSWAPPTQKRFWRRVSSTPTRSSARPKVGWTLRALPASRSAPGPMATTSTPSASMWWTAPAIRPNWSRSPPATD